jgi:hypothetical protein
MYVFVSLLILLVSTVAFTVNSWSEASDHDFADEEKTKNLSSRKSYDYITTFDGGWESKEFDFDSGGGTESVFVNFSKRTKVLNAKVEIEGRGGITQVVYNFTNMKNGTAWKGDLSGIPPTGIPSTYEDVEFVGKEITAIQKIDNTRADHDSSGFKTTRRIYHMFEFNVSSTSPVKFKFYWIGTSYLINSMGLTLNEVNTYIYCLTNTTWVNIDKQAPGHSSNVKRFVVDKEIDQAGNYVDPKNSLVYCMVVGPAINPNAKDNGRTGTDFVELTAYTSGATYPSDVSLNVGGDGENEWSYSDEFKTKVEVSDAQGLKTELQEHIDAAGTVEGFVLVEFRLKSGSSGRLWIGNLNISVEELEHNDPPKFVLGSLGHFYMTEDDLESGDNLIDLTLCFTDDHDTPPNLRYAIAAQEDSAKLEAKMDADGYHVDFIPAEDFFGTLTFRVNATDSGADELPDTFDDRMCLTNYFNVSVRPVNDAPEIEVPGEQLSVNESAALVFEVVVSDVDDDSFAWETNLTDRVTITPVDGDSSRAEIEVVPAEEDVGKSIHFTLKVTDEGGGQGDTFKARVYNNITVDVVNLNDPPKIVKLTSLRDLHSEPVIAGVLVRFEDDYAAAEDDTFEISVEATDPDLGIEPNEKLSYEILPERPLDGSLEIDSDTGLITMQPTNGDVGIVKFTITVTDWQGEGVDQDVEIDVVNQNDPPRDIRIVKPLGRNFTTDDKIDFKGECDDDDLYIPYSEEYLTFIWFTNHSAEPLGMDEEIYDRELSAGWHEITLKVIDDKDESISTSIVILVEEADAGPGPIDDPDKDKDKDKDKDNNTIGDDDKTGSTTEADDKEGNTIYMGALAVIIIVIVIILVLFGVIIPKRKKKEGEDKKELTPTPAPLPGFGMQPGYGQFPPVPQPIYPQQPFAYGQAPPVPIPQVQVAQAQLPQPVPAAIPTPVQPTAESTSDPTNCPQCGAQMQIGISICPACGHQEEQ